MSEEHENVVRSHESGPLEPQHYHEIFFTGWWYLKGHWPQYLVDTWEPLFVETRNAAQDMVSKLSRKE